MPTWKISGYWCYFKVNDLTKGKPAHIHIETPHGEIEFWLEKTNTKSKDEENLIKGSPRVLLNSVIKVKRIKGRVSEEEQNEIERIVKKKKNLFLKEWNRRKEEVGK